MKVLLIGDSFTARNSSRAYELPWLSLSGSRIRIRDVLSPSETLAPAAPASRPGAFGGIGTFHGKPMPTPDMAAARRFSGPVLEELARARILGVRAGTEHRYAGVWVVVVEGRAFVRSWNDKPTGWYRAFQAQPLGSIQLAGREIAVRARRLRGERLRDAVTRAYAEKYKTKASEKWVRGFAEPGRAATTLELLPA